METKRVEQPCAGHFICGDMCTFHRNTALVRGDNALIISTVGDMRARGGQETPPPSAIGANRWFETMVFRAKLQAPDTCCAYRMLSGEDIDFDCPEDAQDPGKNIKEWLRQAKRSQEQHEAMVEKYFYMEVWP